MIRQGKLFGIIVKRELEILRRDADIFLIILVAPLFYAFFYGGVYLHKGETDVPVAVVDADRTPLSRELIRRIDAHQLVRVAEETGDFREGEQWLQEGRVEGTVVIPEGFAENIARGRGGDVTLELNTTRFLVSNDMNKGINEACQSLGTCVRPAAAGGTIRADMRPLFNVTETYGDFLIPGILIVILQQTMWIGLGESLGKERESGPHRNLANAIVRGREYLVFMGKLVPYVTIFAAYALFLYTVHFSLFEIPFRGDPLVFAAVLLLFLLAAGCVGFFVGTFFPKKILALQIIGFTSYPIFLMTGYSWPTMAMPEVLRGLAMFFPMTPFLGASTRILQMGAGVEDVLPEMMHLLILTIVGAWLSLWRLRRPRAFAVGK